MAKVTAHPPEAITARVLALSLLDEIEATMMQGVPTKKAIREALDRHEPAWCAIHPPEAIRTARTLLQAMGAADFLTTMGRSALLTPEVARHLQDQVRRARRGSSIWSRIFG